MCNVRCAVPALTLRKPARTLPVPALTLCGPVHAPRQDHPEQLRGKLESLLADSGVEYKHATTTKFANFLRKGLE